MWRWLTSDGYACRVRRFARSYRSVWAMDETGDVRPSTIGREHVVPTGGMHLVFRLSDNPLRLFDDAGGARVIK